MPLESDFINNPNTYRRIQGLHPRIHAKRLDRLLGFKIPKIEVKLMQKYRAYYKDNDESNRKKQYHGTQTWIGLHPQVLQTPYNDLYDVLSLLKDFKIQRVVDIGAGYGRVGFVANALFPSSRFIGFEILSKRGNEANRVFESLNMINCEVLNENVLEDDFILPKAEVYFIYDFSEATDIAKILDTLSSRRGEYNFFLITRGDRVDYLLSKKYKEFWSESGCFTSGEFKIYNSICDMDGFKHEVVN